MQVNKNIVKIQLGVFSITTPNYQNSQLILDFNPFINELINRGIFIENHFLLHYQAKPKYAREWGLYDINKDNYFSISKFNYGNVQSIEDISFDENLINTKPHAVVLIKLKG